MIEILALRHAPTAWNAQRRIQGRSDVPLSAEGEAAARAWRLPEDASGWPCLSSPLLRAVQTARCLGLSPVAHAAFTEMDWGALEGRTLSDVRAGGGAAFADNEALGLDFRPEGGETPREVGRRASTALATFAESAVLVTHKGVLRALFALATGWDMREKPPVRIMDACCHRFAVLPDASLRLISPNIPLLPDLS